jgi:hypothetical protein
MKKTGDVAGAAAHIADLPFAFQPRSEAGEQFSIERFVLQFGGDVARVFIGDAVVAFLNRVKDLLVHTAL